MFIWKQTFFICEQNFFICEIFLIKSVPFVIVVAVMGHCTEQLLFKKTLTEFFCK